MQGAGIASTGIPSLEELRNSPGFPSEAELAAGPVAVIECVQEIPCNPCEKACPFGAIQVGEPITNLPRLLADKCQGCGLCIAACPGLAVFLVDLSFSERQALVSFPFEFLPVPEKDTLVDVVNRAGEVVGRGRVHKVAVSGRQDRTAVVTVVVHKNLAGEVRGMRRLGGTNYEGQRPAGVRCSNEAVPSARPNGEGPWPRTNSSSAAVKR